MASTSNGEGGVKVTINNNQHNNNQSTSNSNPATPITGLPVCSHRENRWSSGLCHCFDDIDSCCTTCWCPCVTFGRIANILDQGKSSCECCGILYVVLMFLPCTSCFLSFCYRRKMRIEYSLEEGPCNDCTIHCCCELCALCQMHRHLQDYGRFDMQIGWYENCKRMLQAPQVHQPMRS